MKEGPMPKSTVVVRSPAEARCPQQAVALELVALAQPVIRLLGVDGSQEWFRDRRDTGHIARRVLRYDLHGEPAEATKRWNAPGACVYFAVDELGSVRHVGKSTRRFRDRWRMSPALDVARRPMPGKQLFHSTGISSAVQAFEAAKHAGRSAHFDIVVARMSQVPRGLLKEAFDSAHPLVTNARHEALKKAPDEATARQANVLEAWLRTARSDEFLDWNKE
jgi:hypothetical protein